MFLWIFRSYIHDICIYVNVSDCFNPCSYGFSVLTQQNRTNGAQPKGFNPCSYGFSVLTKIFFLPTNFPNRSFNPCSYGFSVLTDEFEELCVKGYGGFNPCSYGFSVLTLSHRHQRKRQNQVSILVLMDFPFLHKWGEVSIKGIAVSILVLMDFPFLL